jgi:hypothetical protein
MARADRVHSTPPLNTPISYRTPLRSYLLEAVVIAFLLIGSAAAGCAIVHTISPDVIAACSIARGVR